MKRITHIGVVVKDLEAACSRWSRLLGLKVVKRASLVSIGVNSAFLCGQEDTEGLLIELVEPVDPEDASNPIVRRLSQSGEGVLNICMIYDDLESVMQSLSSDGVRFITEPAIHTGKGPRVIVSPKATNNVLVELVSSDDWDDLWHARAGEGV